MPAQQRNITIEQGATFFDEFTWHADSMVTPGTPGDPIPLTGALVRMQIRRVQGSEILLQADSSSNGITLDAPAGKVSIELPPAKTNLLVSRSCRYDVEAVFGDDDVHRLVEGSVTVRPNITQEPGDPIVTR